MSTFILLPLGPSKVTKTAVKRKRKRNHAHTAARRAERVALRAAEFDHKCRLIAVDEIRKVLKMAAEIEEGR